MRYSLDGKTILITGASSGIGAEFGRLLGRRGRTIVLVARSRDRLAEIARDVSGNVRVTPCDLSRRDGVDALLDAVRDLDVDVLINNAGVGLIGSVASYEEERLLPMLELNVIAPTRLVRGLLPPMVKRGHGAILNVGSTAGCQAGPFMSSYAAGKSYVNNFTEGLATELLGTGVTVTLLCPGATRTNFFRRADIPVDDMLKFAMDPRPVAVAGIRALERGQVICVPGFVNRMLMVAQRASPRWLVRRVTRRLFGALDR